MRLKIILLIVGFFHVLPIFSQVKTNLFIHDIKTDKKPWTNTDFQNAENDFNFAVVADRTNGHRSGVFEKAVHQLNALNPEFVISVGDFIEGYTTNKNKLDQQWSEFRSGLAPLNMPFFMVPGNHDLSNAVQNSLWEELYGPNYYFFIYKDVLFLVLNTNDGDGTPLSQEQISYAQRILEDHKEVRWTFLFMHHPVWDNATQNGFDKIEASLKERNYTVVAGHTHSYMHTVRNNQNYYLLGTTGGKSDLRGSKFGETDHIGWFSMREGKPTLVNLELDGILDHDFSDKESRQISKLITEDVQLDPFVLLPNQEKEQVILYLKFNNQAKDSRVANLNFFQHPYLIPSIVKIDTILAPESESVRKVEFTNPTQHALSPLDSLDWNWNFKYRLRNELPSLGGNSHIALVRSEPKLIDKSTPVFIDKKEIKILNPYEQSVIRYTLDGSEPTLSSAIYEKPFSIDQTRTIRIKLFTPDGSAESLDERVDFKKIKLYPAMGRLNKNFKEGLNYAYYEGVFERIPDFSKLTPIKKGVTKDLDIEDIKERQNNFALLIDGYILMERDGLYKFHLTSDDGCNLYINDQLIVDNDGSHSALTKSGFVALKKGLHPIRFEYFEDFDGELIRLEYESEGQPLKEVPYSSYFRNK